MGHITSKEYMQLQARLDKAPQGTPKSETIFKILEHLFTKKEAELVSKLPIRPFTLTKATTIWKISKEESEKILEGLADKGLVVDLTRDREKVYTVSPPMAGFFEWSIMKMGGHFNKKLLSELYYQYINKEDDFAKRVFALNPPMARAYVHEDTIQEKDKDIIMDYEKVTQAVEKATAWAVGICYCRHKMEHLGSVCDHSMEVCLIFNEGAKSMIKHKIYREITKEEAMEIVKKSRDEGLVQIGSNMQDGISWICNCCGCCCEALLAYKRLGYNPRMETNWLAKNKNDICTSCGICVKKCPVNAITIVKEGIEKTKTYAKIDSDKCIGCGVCTRFCPVKSLSMERRKETVFVPKDSFERHILEAIDTNTLQNLIFDNYNLWGFGVLREFLKILFILPPAKWLLAKRQMASRFIQAAGNYYYNKDPEMFDGKPDYSHPEMEKKF